MRNLKEKLKKNEKMRNLKEKMKKMKKFNRKYTKNEEI